MAKRIFLFDIFGESIATRSAMSNFFDYLRSFPENEIVLDFTNLLFISRSCADEYIKRKLNIPTKIITEENMLSEVKAMFFLACNQYKKEIGLITV